MINMNTEFGLSVLFDGFLAAIAAIGFAVISNPPKKAVFIAACLLYTSSLTPGKNIQPTRSVYSV